MMDEKTKLKFVVTGCGHSATRYMMRVFTVLKVPCGFEDVFFESGKMRENTGGIVGDSSWKAAPYLADNDFGGVVFHQLRHPLPTVNSFIKLGKLAGLKDWKPYLDFDGCSVEVGAMRVYLEWNRMCELARCRSYIRYQVESLTPEMVSGFCSLIGMLRPMDVIKGVLDTLPRIINWHGRESYSWDDLPDCDEKEELFRLGRKYGYNPKAYDENEKKSYSMTHVECGYVCEGTEPPGRCPKCGSYTANWQYDWDVPDVVKEFMK